MAELRDYVAATVLLGRFNPLIFSPEWLATNQMIGPEEALAARETGIEVMAPNITSILLGSMKVIVEEGRFVLNVTDEPLIRAKDLPVSAFRLLSHTPVYAVGINVSASLHCSDDAKWNRLGDRLAPKDPWGDFVQGPGDARLGGLRAIVMERTKPASGRSGFVRCTFQISDSAPNEGVIQVNNHFTLGSQKDPGTGSEAYHLIEELWDEEYSRSQKLITHIKDLADAA